MTNLPNARLYLSPPDVTDQEIEAVVDALKSGWVAPLGPEVDQFESEIAAYVGTRHAVALSSGTAALHLGLLGLGVVAGSEVVVPTMTFGATAFAVTYVGAKPVFLDVESESWNLDPELLETFLRERAAAGCLPAAIITVDIFGLPADHNRFAEIAGRYDVPIFADSAEALGSTFMGRQCASFGRASVVSFNGNKIMTTSGGGMLLTDDQKLADKVRFWSAQSRDPQPWYEHSEIGFNYRMSNILAALGRVQLKRLPAMMQRRRDIRNRYESILSELDGVGVIGDPTWGQSNCWLTVVRFDPRRYSNAPTRIRESLDRQGIECRPVWKPMHQQPVFRGSKYFITGVADNLFKTGLCLPSGSSMSADDADRVGESVLRELSTD